MYCMTRVVNSSSSINNNNIIYNIYIGYTFPSLFGASRAREGVFQRSRLWFIYRGGRKINLLGFLGLIALILLADAVCQLCFKDSNAFITLSVCALLYAPDGLLCTLVCTCTKSSTPEYNQVSRERAQCCTLVQCCISVALQRLQRSGDSGGG